MTRSYKTRRVSVDSEALVRLESLAREVDIYDGRREATNDDYERILNFLMDSFQEEHDL